MSIGFGLLPNTLSCRDLVQNSDEEDIVPPPLPLQVICDAHFKNRLEACSDVIDYFSILFIEEVPDAPPLPHVTGWDLASSASISDPCIERLRILPPGR